MMHSVRHMLSCLVIAIIVAVGMSGFAMATNTLEHQMHCLDTSDTAATNDPASLAHHRGHDDALAQHADPGHDHATCMLHGCPALSVDATPLRTHAGTLVTKLSWHEQPLLVLHISAGLKRPPRT